MLLIGTDLLTDPNHHLVLRHFIHLEAFTEMGRVKHRQLSLHFLFQRRPCLYHSLLRVHLRQEVTALRCNHLIDLFLGCAERYLQVLYNLFLVFFGHRCLSIFEAEKCVFLPVLQCSLEALVALFTCDLSISGIAVEHL